jgi:addiction module RelE/StbE family toxin
MIEWTDHSLQQLDHAHDYIALSNSESVAERITMLMVSSVQQLENFPMSGRAGRVRGTRELVIPQTPFLVVYTLEHGQITVLAIYHGAQRWPETF